MSNETEPRGRALSRRLLLQGAMGAMSVAATTAARTEPAFAGPKISKAAVAYQDHPQDDKRCGKCLQFQAPDNCKLVAGPVSPEGFCRIFTPSPQAARPVKGAPLIG